tara:strand:- start:2218 stop:3996 length:1779 start_codon:yes stop_codon:yes gene_type:complete
MAKIPDIKIKFRADGQPALKKAIDSLNRSTKALINSQAKIVASTQKQTRTNKNLGDGILALNGKQRLLNNSFATLRSKMLLASFGAGLFTLTIGKLIKAEGQQEKAEKKLSTSLGRRSEDLLAFASEQQRVTTFGDEETIQAMSLLGAYTDNEEAIKRLTKASMDLAVAKGMDLNAAVDLVGKSVFSSTNALSRYGVVIEGSTGSTERLSMATQALGNMYGGQAQAQSQTMTGSIQQMGNAVGDTAEAIGKLLAPVVITIAQNFKSAAEGSGEFFKEMKNIIDFGNAMGEIDDSSIEILQQRKKDNEEILKSFLRQTVSGKKLKKEQKDQLELAKALIKTLNTQLAIKQLIIDSENRTTEIQNARNPSEEIAWEEAFLLKQEEIVAKKQQEIDQIDFITEMYPELAKRMGLVNTESMRTAENMEKLAEFSSRTMSSLITSALMGDSLSDSIKRSIVNMVVMVAQAKLYEYFMRKAKESMEAVQTGGVSTVFNAIKDVGSFLFGHTGGEVTEHGIKRFHSGGLASDETPAILQQGEFVLSKNAVQSIGLESARRLNEGRGGSGVQIHIHGGVVQEDYITNELIPAINKAKALA